MRSTRRTCSWVLSLALLACGDPIIDGAQLDAPGITVRGRFAEPADSNAKLHIGLLWIDPTQRAPGNVVAPKAQMAETLTRGEFRVEVYGSPPQDMIASFESDAWNGNPLTLAWAELVLFEDGNGDSSFEVGSLAQGSPIKAPDAYRGMSENDLLIYIADPLPPDAAIVQGLSQDITSKRGYHLARANCTPAPPRFAEATKASELVVIPATSRFPDLRACLHSHQ